jgi:hypothetical protein
VLVEDDLPALKAVCDKLEEAYNKVSYSKISTDTTIYFCGDVLILIRDILFIEGSCCLRN